MPVHVASDGGIRGLNGLLAVVSGALTAAGVVAAAVASFELNPAGPVIVSLVAVVSGVFIVRRMHDPLARGAAIGLVAGSLLAVLLWPLFSV
jgi:hypothetical protein